MNADFPNLGNVDVYAYENTFDYSRFKPNARLKMCNVPWCGDYENVVKFENDTARDQWFDALSGDVVNLETMFNVKPDGSAKVPVPVTSAQIFDYSRFTPNARLKMCNVPWCGDYENVVKFENDTERDAWFDALKGDVVTLDSMFNVKPVGSAKVPVPVTSAQGYNYLVVDLPRMTSDAQPIEYANGERKARYFYFILDAQQLSPLNSTRLVLELDMWTTYINGMQFDYILLERGHAPVASSPVADYLANPRDNSAYLLTADVNTGGEPYIERSRAVKNYSAASQRACIATTCDLQVDFGTATAPTVPALSEPDTSGILAPRVYSVAVEDLQKFLRAMEKNAPWIKQCVLGVFFAPSELLTQSGGFTLWGVAVTICDAVQKVETFLQPGISDFGYPAQAAPFAKLYTYPYAAIRVSDERGQSSIVRVEDLGPQGIELASAVNLIMPYIVIDARLLGIAGATDTLTFQTMEGRTYDFGGAWGAYLKSWNLPIMQVTQSAASRADYTTVYNRAHAKLAADNAQASALASNATAYTNADNAAANIVDLNRVNVNANNSITTNANAAAWKGATAANQKRTAGNRAHAKLAADNAQTSALASNATAYTNADNAAANVVDLNRVNVNANNSITTNANAAALKGATAANQKLKADCDSDNATSTSMADLQNDVIAITTANNNATAATRTIGSVVTGAFSGGASGATTAAVSGVTDMAVSFPSANAAAAVSQSSNVRAVGLAQTNALEKTLHAAQYTAATYGIQSETATNNTNIRNDASTYSANASATLTRTNAGNTKTTGDANANRAHATAIDAINAGLKQACIAAPVQFGASANGGMSATAPRALFAQIVTQRECDIMNAASAFARYGYTLKCNSARAPTGA